MTFRKVSAKTGINVMNSFQNIIMELQRGNKKNNQTAEDDPETKFQN